MNIDEMVMKFVKNSRKSVYNKISECEQKRLETLFDDCLCSVVKNLEHELLPTFIICKTFNKYSKILPVKRHQGKYKYYLLFDCYMNGINRVFDSIYLGESDSGHDVWKLAYELYAEEALINKDEILLPYYGLNNVALGPYDVDNEKNNILSFIMDIQERYIIGHELGHWVYKILGDPTAKDLINIIFHDNKDILIDEIKEILRETYSAYRQIFQKKEYIKLIDEQASIINESSEILEECFADAIAYAMIFAYIKEKHPIDREKQLLAGQALLLEMMTLQLLAMQHKAFSEESFESSTSIRLAFLRNYVGLYYEDDEMAFNCILEKTVIRYEERITNIMIECFSELENRADYIYNALIDSENTLDVTKLIGFSYFE